MNANACFADCDGDSVNAVRKLTKAYTDETRSALTVTVSSFFESDVCCVYGYRFFYRSLLNGDRKKKGGY